MHVVAQINDRNNNIRSPKYLLYFTLVSMFIVHVKKNHLVHRDSVHMRVDFALYMKNFGVIAKNSERLSFE